MSKVVVAEGFERIHRSCLVGIGTLPLQLREGPTVQDLKLEGTLRYGLCQLLAKA